MEVEWVGGPYDGQKFEMRKGSDFLTVRVPSKIDWRAFKQGQREPTASMMEESFILPIWHRVDGTHAVYWNKNLS